MSTLRTLKFNFQDVPNPVVAFVNLSNRVDGERLFSVTKKDLIAGFKASKVGNPDHVVVLPVTVKNPFLL